MIPLVSVVIPVYNNELYLAKTIISVLKQSYDNTQILLINDGSTDNSKEICLSYLEDKRVMYFEHENKGSGYTRNVGISESKGAYIAFIDSDDVWHKDKLKKQMMLFQTDETIDIVYSRIEIIDAYDKLVSDYNIRLHSGNVLDHLYIDNFICTSSVVLKKNILEKTGMFDEQFRISQDYEFWLRVALTSTFAFVNECLVQYRVHDAQISKKVKNRMDALEIIYNKFDKNNPKSVSLVAKLKSRSLGFENKASYYKSNNEKIKEMKSHLVSLCYYPFNYNALAGLVKLFIGYR